MRSPRKVPSKDEKYMGLAFFHSFFSKDPDTQVGAVVIDKNGLVVGTGYNGPPALFCDDKIDWSRPNKYTYVKHAEDNALDRILVKDTGNVLYVTGRPCEKCMLKIIDFKILNVVYFNYAKINQDPNSMLNNSDGITEKLAIEAGVYLKEFEGDLTWIENNIIDYKKKGLFNK